MHDTKYLSGIRCFYTLTIVLCHLYLTFYDMFVFGIASSFITHGGWAVSSFFVISGFLTNMSYGAKIDSVPFAFGKYWSSPKFGVNSNPDKMVS